LRAHPAAATALEMKEGAALGAAGAGEEGGSGGGGRRGRGGRRERRWGRRGRGCGGGGEEGGSGGRGPPGQGSCGGGAQGRCGGCEDEHRCWLACTPPRTTPATRSTPRPAPSPGRRAGSAQSPLPDSRGPCTGCCSSPPPPLLRPPPPSSLPPLLRLAAVQLRAAPARLDVAQPLPAAPSPSRLTVRGRGFLAAPLAPVARRQAAARHHNGLDAGSPAALPPVPTPPAAGRLKGGER